MLVDRTPNPRSQLAAEILVRFGELRLRVTGTSMLPAIWPGDVLKVQRRSLDQIKPGDVALIHRGGRMFAHRVLRQHGSSLLIRGDALVFPDPPVSPSDLLGVVVAVEPSSQRIAIRLLRRCSPLLAPALRRLRWLDPWPLRLLNLAHPLAQSGASIETA